jgi:hypothetical protein
MVKSMHAASAGRIGAFPGLNAGRFDGAPAKAASAMMARSGAILSAVIAICAVAKARTPRMALNVSAQMSASAANVWPI